MYRKAFQSSCLIAASLGLLVACNSGDVNIPGVEWPDNSSGPAGVIAFAEVSYSATEGEVVNIRVSRTGGSSGWASVDYACADGSAAAGADFTGVSGRLTWISGQQGNRTISIPITDDDVAEAAESFSVVLSNVSWAGLGAISTTTVNIIDNDPVAVSILGPITKADDVTIDGISYDAGTAIVSVNGYPATASDLKLGQFVELEGEVNFSNATGTAQEVSHFASVIGPIEGVNAEDRQLTVMGQTVLIDEDTAFAGSIDPDTLAGLAIGATAQVSGYRNAEDQIVATRIEPDSMSSGVQLLGTVADLDLANMRFRIGGLDVDYENATLVDLPSGMPETGRLVMVRGSLSNGALAVEELASGDREE